MIGRFTHVNEKINIWAQEIAQIEQKLYDETTIIAEVVHLPEDRIGNIISRTNIREYEIPYLAASSLKPEKQISVQDLMVSVVDNQIILTSITLGKRVQPKLSSAHNFAYNTLPVYEFLCDLQYQREKAGFTFDWGSLSEKFAFLPRGNGSTHYRRSAHFRPTFR